MAGTCLSTRVVEFYDRMSFKISVILKVQWKCVRSENTVAGWGRCGGVHLQASVRRQPARLLRFWDKGCSETTQGHREMWTVKSSPTVDVVREREETGNIHLEDVAREGKKGEDLKIW